MKATKKIRDGLQALGGHGIYEIYTGEVVAVDEEKTLIDVQINDNVVIYDVRLKVVIDNNNGLFIVPKPGSFVAIAQLDGGQDYALLQASEIDKVWLKIADTTWEVSSAGMVINGGANLGIVKVESLVKRLNEIETALTEIKTGFASHVHPSNGAPPAAPYTYQVPNSTNADFENTKVTH